MSLTVVLPTYNEAENLPLVFSALLALPVPGLRLLVVDDNSPDGTGQIAEEWAARRPGQIGVLHQPGKSGLGRAYLNGFAAAIRQGADILGQMDSDLSHPPDRLPALLAALETSDIAIGSRYVPGGSVDLHWPAWRKGLSAFGNYYARTILRLPLRDVTGGFRLYRRSALTRMPLDRIRSNGYVFQVEMAYQAYLVGCKFAEVPIYFADRRWGRSKMSLGIQAEAALRIWQVLFAYRDLSSRS